MLGQAGVPVAAAAPPPVSAQHAGSNLAVPRQTPTVQQPTIASQQPAPQRAQPALVDPAILSYGKSPIPRRGEQPDRSMREAPATPVKAALAKAAESLPVNGSPFVAEAGNVGVTRKGSKARNTSPPIQYAQTSQAEMAEGKAVTVEELEEGQAENGSRRKTRRGQKKKAVGAPTSSDPPPVMNIEVSRNGNDMDGSVKRGKGWRQTPLLTGHSESPMQQPRSSKQGRRQRDQDREMQNGWATEEATDVQDMGDFDFEASNKLFDKKTVFDELRQGDTTADEDRLVGHNRVSRPGTYGGKNLHPTENVLSPKLAPDSADSSTDAETELNLGNGRSSSKHSTTRAGIGKKAGSRQNSLQVDGKPHPLSASMSSDRGGMNRSVASLASRTGKNVPSLATSSPRPDRTQSPQSAVSAFTAKMATAPASAVQQEPHFILRETLASCPVLLPSALETLEAETVSRFGLTHEALTETAARAIAETAMSMFDPFSGSRRNSRNNNTTLRASISTTTQHDRTATPVIVILAGNNDLGARAVAASRHLVTRNCALIVAEQQFENAETQNPQMRTQTAILKRMQRAAANIKRGPWRKASNYIKNLSRPPVLIIDALLAGATYESLLDSTTNAAHATAAQLETRAMIDWANRSRAPVLSVGCPSGVSGVDGEATMVEGEPLAVRPERVLALGAPLMGLLAAARAGERWDVRLADVGVNIALRKEEAVGFGALWVGELRFVEEEHEVGY